MIVDLSNSEISAIQWALGDSQARLSNDISRGRVQYDMSEKEARELSRELSQLAGLFHLLTQRSDQQERQHNEALKRIVKDATQPKTA